MSVVAQTSSWETVSLDDVSKCIDYGHTASSSKSEVGPKFLRITDIQDGSVDWNKVPYCKCSTDERTRYRLEEGDIVFARTGATTGKSFLIGHCPVDAVFASYLIRVRPDRKVYPGYLAHFFDTPNYWAQISKSSTGSTQPGVNSTKLKSLKIPLPPLAEQKRIAAILDKADAIRRKRQQAIQLTEQFLRSTFLDMFGDPVTNPKGWPMTTFGERCELVTGYAFKSQDYIGSTGIRLCRGANVLPDTIDWSDVRFWPSEDHSIDQKYVNQRGDVILAMDRPWISSGLKVARLTKNDIPSLLVQRVSRLRSCSTFSNAFIYYSIRHPAFTRHCAQLATETTVPHISPNDIRSYRLPDPPGELLDRFALLVEKSEYAIERTRKAWSRSDNLFNSLVQRAFRGEL